jgi:predicted nucleic-acid-binding Zn-ribbon protein
MKENTCPKCGSRDLGTVESPRGGLGANVIMTGVFAYVRITRWLCFGCGYTEEWVRGREQLERLRPVAKQHARG